MWQLVTRKQRENVIKHLTRGSLWVLVNTKVEVVENRTTQIISLEVMYHLSTKIHPSRGVGLTAESRIQRRSLSLNLDVPHLLPSSPQRDSISHCVTPAWMRKYRWRENFSKNIFLPHARARTPSRVQLMMGQVLDAVSDQRVFSRRDCELI